MAEEVDLSVLQKRLEAIEAAEEGEKSIKALRKEISELTNQQIAQIEAISAKNSSIATAIERERDARENIGQMHAIQLERLERRLELKTDENERERVHEEILRVKIEHIERIQELQGEISEQQKEDLDTAKEELKILREKMKLKKEEKGLQDGLTKSFGKLFNLKAAKGPFSVDGIGKTAGDFGKLVKSAGGFGKAMKKLGPQLGATILKKWSENIVNLAIALFNAEQNFMATTGASKKFAREMTNSYEATRRYGISIKDATKTTKALFKTFTDYSEMSGHMRIALQNTTSVLAAQGFAAEKSAKIVQAASKGMGVALGDEEEVLREIITTARDLELDVSKHAGDIAGNVDKMYQYGNKTRQVMKDLTIAYKTTGIEMSRILTLAEKFDTFDGAAESAGKLNAALGGNFVNAMELMRATNPVERLMLIKGAIDKTGLSFNEMDYYQRKMFMNAAGMKDESELAKLMSGNYEELAGKVGKSAEHYEDLTKHAGEVQNIQKSLQSLLATLTPILVPIIKGLEQFVKLLVEHPTAVKVFGSIVLGLAAALLVLAAVPLKVAIAIGVLVAAIGTLIFDVFGEDVGASTFFEGIGKLAHLFGDMAGFAEAAVAPIKALGAAFSWVGSKIKGAWEGAKNFVGFISDPEEMARLGEEVKEKGYVQTLKDRNKADFARTQQQALEGGLSESRFLEGSPPATAATAAARERTAAATAQMTGAPAVAVRANREAAQMQAEEYQIAAAKQQPAKYEPKIDVYIGQEKLEKIAGEQARVQMGTLAREGLYGTG